MKHGEVGPVLLEQRAREHVAEEQHNAHNLVGLDTSRNDTLGKIARIRLERLKRAGLQRFDVVVVHRGCFREDFLFRHRGE